MNPTTVVMSIYSAVLEADWIENICVRARKWQVLNYIGFSSCFLLSHSFSTIIWKQNLFWFYPSLSTAQDMLHLLLYNQYLVSVRKITLCCWGKADTVDDGPISFRCRPLFCKSFIFLFSQCQTFKWQQMLEDSVC